MVNQVIKLIISLKNKKKLNLNFLLDLIAVTFLELQYQLNNNHNNNRDTHNNLLKINKFQDNTQIAVLMHKEILHKF